MVDRVPPQSIEAEQAVLGAILISKEALHKVADFLRAEDFYRDSHKLIYRAMFDLYSRNEAVDVVTVTEIIRVSGQLERIGGIAYLSALVNIVPTAANVVYHARIVEEKSIYRQLIDTATTITGMGYEAKDNVNAVVDQAERMIMEVAGKRGNQDFMPIREIVHSAFDKIEKLYENKGGITGLPTGFRDLDKLTAGLQESDLILIAARPSMGKTAFVLNIAQHIGIRAKQSVAFFSLEMSKEQLVQRMLCAEAGIDLQRLRIGQLMPDDWDKLMKSADKLSKAQIFIDDTASISVLELRSKARKLKAEHDLKLVIIDYLQLMQGSASGSKSGGENRQQEISEISRSLKALARELKVPVIALSQLSRGVEARQSKRPMLSDLRESGSLEQDADIVMFLYREEYYKPETENKNTTDVIIAKFRNGPTDTVQLFFNKKYTRFADLSNKPESAV